MNETIKIKSTSGDFEAYMSYPEKMPGPGIVLIHEVWGLDAHIRNMADRFAKEGYVVLAPDLLSDTGITKQINPSILNEIQDPGTRDEAQKKMRAATAPLQVPEFGIKTVAKLKVCVSALRDDAKRVNGKVAVVGFCFGGTYAYALAAADDRLVAAVPFYGHAPQPFEKLQTITCPVLAFYGEEDTMLVGQVQELREKMHEYGKKFEAVVYAKAGHAFMNDTNPTRYRKQAAELAWKKTLEFLGETK